MRRIYIAGRSKDSWFQLSPGKRVEYKINLAEKDGLKCSKNNGNGCGKHFPLDMLSVDHIIPISMGGYICDIHNMQLLCFKCHERKTINIDNKRKFPLLMLTYTINKTTSVDWSSKHALNHKVSDDGRLQRI